MPKKFKGENSKAAEARARQTAKKDEEDTRKQKEVEDEYWKDDDKHVLKKQQRKDDKEKKRTEQLEKKKEAQKLLDEEMAGIKSQKVAPPPKITRSDVEKHREAIEAASTSKAANETPVTELPIEENINRLSFEGDEARTVGEAISVLSTKPAEEDLHPEKRVKAAYLAFEEKNLPLLKEDNPNLRLSQLKQLLKKDWNKSPENPLNQRLATKTQ